MSVANILVFDDESSIRIMVRTSLEVTGHLIRGVENGAVALEMSSNEQFDLMLLDMSMPVMDGMSVLKSVGTLRQMNNEATAEQQQVVILTAYVSIDLAVKATLAGASDLIEKPSMPEELRTVVEEVLTRPLVRSSPLIPVDILAGGYESRSDYPLASKFYGKAMATKRGGYSPAERNLHRIHEIQRFGKSQIDVDLGEGPAVPPRYH